jgi:hypothetical protein
MGAMYAKSLPYYNELVTLTRKAEAQYNVFNIFIKRTKPFDTFGRVQKSLAEATGFDALAREIITDIWLEVTGDREGLTKLINEVVTVLE